MATGRLVAGVAATVIGFLAVLPRASAEDDAWRQFKGQVVISDVLLAKDFGSDQVMITSLNRVRATGIDEVDGFWRLHLVAFLDPPAGDGALRIAARDVTPPANPPGAHPRAPAKPVRAFEVAVDPGQKILHLNNLVLTEAMGFKRGHQYEVTVEKNPEVDGKADVHARGVITLR